MDKADLARRLARETAHGTDDWQSAIDQAWTLGLDDQQIIDLARFTWSPRAMVDLLDHVLTAANAMSDPDPTDLDDLCDVASKSMMASHGRLADAWRELWGTLFGRLLDLARRLVP